MIAIRREGSAAARRPAITQPAVPPGTEYYKHLRYEVSHKDSPPAMMMSASTVGVVIVR